MSSNNVEGKDNDRIEEPESNSTQSNSTEPRPIAKPRAILNREQAIEIFQLRPSGTNEGFERNSLAVARTYKVSEKTVRDIWRARTWHRETLHLDPSRPARADTPPGRPLGRKDSAPRRRPAPRLSEIAKLPAAKDADDPFHDDWPNWDRADQSTEMQLQVSAPVTMSVSTESSKCCEDLAPIEYGEDVQLQASSRRESDSLITAPLAEGSAGHPLPFADGDAWRDRQHESSWPSPAHAGAGAGGPRRVPRCCPARLRRAQSEPRPGGTRGSFLHVTPPHTRPRRSRVAASVRMPRTRPPTTEGRTGQAALRKGSRRTGSRVTNFLGRSWAGVRVIPARSSSRLRPSPPRRPSLLPSQTRLDQAAARVPARGKAAATPHGSSATLRRHGVGLFQTRGPESDSGVLAERAPDRRVCPNAARPAGGRQRSPPGARPRRRMRAGRRRRCRYCRRRQPGFLAATRRARKRRWACQLTPCRTFRRRRAAWTATAGPAPVQPSVSSERRRRCNVDAGRAPPRMRAGPDCPDCASESGRAVPSGRSGRRQSILFPVEPVPTGWTSVAPGLRARRNWGVTSVAERGRDENGGAGASGALVRGSAILYPRCYSTSNGGGGARIGAGRHARDRSGPRQAHTAVSAGSRERDEGPAPAGPACADERVVRRRCSTCGGRSRRVPLGAYLDAARRGCVGASRRRALAGHEGPSFLLLRRTLGRAGAALVRHDRTTSPLRCRCLVPSPRLPRDALARRRFGKGAAAPAAAPPTSLAAAGRGPESARPARVPAGALRLRDALPCCRPRRAWTRRRPGPRRAARRRQRDLPLARERRFEATPELQCVQHDSPQARGPPCLDPDSGILAGRAPRRPACPRAARPPGGRCCAPTGARWWPRPIPRRRLRAGRHTRRECHRRLPGVIAATRRARKRRWVCRLAPGSVIRRRRATSTATAGLAPAAHPPMSPSGASKRRRSCNAHYGLHGECGLRPPLPPGESGA